MLADRDLGKRTVASCLQVCVCGNMYVLINMYICDFLKTELYNMGVSVRIAIKAERRANIHNLSTLVVVVV